MTFSWFGRQLQTADISGTSVTYKYNADGLRTEKKVGSTVHTYEYTGSTLFYENRGGMQLHYRYDVNGNLASITRIKADGTKFTLYAVCNSRGDVEELRTLAGDLYARYIYDTWGNTLHIYNASGAEITSTANLAMQNPLLFRGYYYDAETGLYYLQSRYYDPITHRFINADGVIADVGGSIQGYNMFAYCFNNPVNMFDAFGYWPQWLTEAVNWALNALRITANLGSVTTTGASVTAKGPTISRNTSLGVASSKASGSLGYVTDSFRGQATQSGSNPTKSIIGGFCKASVLNFDSQNRIGSQNVGISKKDVIDVGTVTAQAGIQYQDGFGVSLGAKASVAAARGTYCIDIFGWKVEVGMSVQFLSYGYEFAYGALPEGGWGVKNGGKPGVFTVGYLIRITPA